MEGGKPVECKNYIEYICSVQEIHELNWPKPAKNSPNLRLCFMKRAHRMTLFNRLWCSQCYIFARFYGRRIFTAPIISSRFPFFFFRFAELFEEQKINEANG